MRFLTQAYNAASQKVIRPKVVLPSQMSEVKLHGIIPAIVNPMNERFDIVEEDVRNYIQWIMKFRIGGLAVNVDTGEGPHLTREERKRVISIVSSIVKGRVPIIAGVPPASTAEAARTAAENREAGADALLVFPHTFFYGQPLPAELPYNYHKAIAEAARRPIVIFQLQPALGGYELGEDVLMRLIQIPEVVAIKEAMFDALKFYNTMRLLRRAPRRITLLTGNDNFIAQSLIMGAEGALIGFGTLATDRQVEMYELIKKGRFREAMEVWEDLIPLMDVIFGPPVRDYRARTKVALALQGVIQNTYVRPPLLGIGREEAERIRDALLKTGIGVERRVETIMR